eukprot:409133-Prorocentrum_minimum.AAC.1
MGSGWGQESVRRGSGWGQEGVGRGSERLSVERFERGKRTVIAIGRCDRFVHVDIRSGPGGREWSNT